MKNKRSLSLDAIKTDLSNVLQCEVKKEDIMKKLHTLKSQFLRERTAMKASHKSGAGTDELYTPKLWCFTELSFLAEGEVIRSSTSSFNETAMTQQVSGFIIKCIYAH